MRIGDVMFCSASVTGSRRVTSDQSLRERHLLKLARVLIRRTGSHYRRLFLLVAVVIDNHAIVSHQTRQLFLDLVLGSWLHLGRVPLEATALSILLLTWLRG